MKGIVVNIHFLIIAYTGWIVWEMWTSHQQALIDAQNRVPVLQSKILKKKKELRQIEQYKKDIEKTKEIIKNVVIEVENLQRKLPESITDAENLALIKDIAEGLNIKNIFLTPGVETNKGFYFTKKYEFKADGTYLQLLIFLEKVSQVDKILNVRRVILERSKKKQRGRFQITNLFVEIEAYRYNAGHKESTGIDSIEKGFNEAGNSKSGGKKKKRRRKKRRR